MTKLSTHFDSSEMTCHCGCNTFIHNEELLKVLEELREVYNQPITINSGCRCEKHNKAVGGELKSQHVLGTAADIVVRGVSPYKTFQYLDKKYKGKYGIGLYSTWVHIDVRTQQSRWSKSA